MVFAFFAIWLGLSIVGFYYVLKWTRQLNPSVQILIRSLLLPLTIWPGGFGGGHGSILLPVFLAWPLQLLMRDAEVIWASTFYPVLGLVVATFLAQLLLRQTRKRRSPTATLNDRDIVDR